MRQEKHKFILKSKTTLCWKIKPRTLIIVIKNFRKDNVECVKLTREKVQLK